MIVLNSYLILLEAKYSRKLYNNTTVLKGWLELDFSFRKFLSLLVSQSVLMHLHMIWYVWDCETVAKQPQTRARVSLAQLLEEEEEEEAEGVPSTCDYVLRHEHFS
jgi:hypothetical protein